MKLLIVTQKVDQNDDVLGFFHEWIREFSKNAEKLTVICLEKGDYDLPENVRVLSLGKERISRRSNIVRRLSFSFTFYRYIWGERNNYDAVFVHMNPEYVILGSFVWKFLNKKIGLWYAHGSINFKLKFASFLSDIIFSSSKSGYRLNSRKLVITGQGINTDSFSPPVGKKSDAVIKIFSIGRISPVKNCHEMIDSVNFLKNKNIKFELSLIGQPITETDRVYFSKLKDQVKRLNLDGEVKFLGSVPFSRISDEYKKYDIFINLSDTGSLDKAVLEAMSSGLIVMTLNEAYKSIFPDNYFLSHDPKKISEAIINAINSDKISLREYVIKNHSLKALIPKIIDKY